MPEYIIREICNVDEKSYDQPIRRSWLAQGKTPLFFASDENMLLGIIAVADVIKEDSASGSQRTSEDMGIRVVMLTGDNERTARAIGKHSWCRSCDRRCSYHREKNVSFVT